MEFKTGEKYTHVLRNDEYYYNRKRNIKEKIILYSCEAEILDPPKTNNSHVLSGNCVYARLSSKRTGRVMNKWVKKTSLIPLEEI